MKRIFTALIIAACMGILYAVGASAQQSAARVFNADVLNGKAVSLPKPVYPEAARRAGVSAAIAVNVIIDEDGAVTSAEADVYDQREQRDADGNKLDPIEADLALREAAESAARQARFSPTLVGGQPVQVKGKIVYNFLAGHKDADLVSTTPVNGGVLNGRAGLLPEPEYPAAAQAVKVEGAVAVQVAIDEAGNVIGANAISGHPLLRAAAEKAALAAKFKPSFVNGKATLVKGVITYNFVLPKNEDQP